MGTPAYKAFKIGSPSKTFEGVRFRNFRMMDAADPASVRRKYRHRVRGIDFHSCIIWPRCFLLGLATYFIFFGNWRVYGRVLRVAVSIRYQMCHVYSTRYKNMLFATSSPAQSSVLLKQTC